MVSSIRLFLLVSVACASNAFAGIAYVQSNAALPQTPQTTVSVTYTAAQAAGDLNVVLVGWWDTTSHVLSVTDTRGNAYSAALAPTTQAVAGTHVIYYAPNVATATAGTNTVTVTFDAAVQYPDVRIAEYSGVATTSPVDVAVGAGGSSATASSGAVTTTNANDLLVAGNFVSSHTTAAGTGFTSRLITDPDGSIIEDQVVSATGSYSATASLTSAPWVMQMVAFKAAAAGGGDTTPPTAPTTLAATATSSTQINLTWTASTDNVAVTNYLIERCAGAGCSNFVQIATSTVASYSNTGLTASTSYSYRVRATDAANNLSSYSSTATASTPAAADTQAPTAPTGLGATAASSTQINLAWTASTDNVGVTNYLIERCAGAGCSNFVQIATSATTSYSNTGLTASTSYSYRVRATDAAGNLSAYSSTATASTPAAADTQAPTAPTGLGATATSSTQVNLTWTASTDNVGVTNYLIERCAGVSCSNFAQIATSTTTSYSNTGLTASTSYSYRVRATDAASNLSSYSATATAATPGAADTQAPTAPTNLATTVISSTQINLTWTASTDNVGVTNYLIERCAGAGCSSFAQIATSATASYNNTGLTAATTYSYRVRATDAASNLSTYSATATATTQAGGGGGTATPAFVQSNYAVPQTPQTSVAVKYTAAQVAGDLNVVLIGWYDTTSHVTSVTDSKGNSYVVGAAPVTQSVAGTHVIYYAPNIGPSAANTNTVTVTFDAAVPYVDVRIAEYSGVATASPVDVAVSGSGSSATSSSGAVMTTNATDLLVAGNYVSSSTTGPGTGFFSRVITNPNGSILEDRTTTATGSYSATAPLPSAPWVMQMVAFRAATTGAPDTTPPTAPSALAATVVSGSQINLTWTASTDNVGVTSYLVERCAGAGCSNFAQIGTAVSAAYVDSGLAAATTYSYRVRATDAANNLSAYSGTATAATSAPDTQAPTAPGNLSATTVSSSQVNLTWAASTDNVGVTSYRVERCLGAGCSTFAQIGTSAGTSYADSTLSASTTYGYRVRAADAAGNLSGYSGTASATTQAGGSLNNLGFVQNASTAPQSPQTSVTATFGATQTAANLNVVIIGWYNTTSNITSVTDTAGNEYTLASGPTTHATAGTQAIYYAANIKATAPGNAITVKFTAAVPYPDMRIAEYTGVDPNNPLDTGAEATGTSQIPNSGLFVTSHAYDLIVAGNYVTSKTTSAGPGFINRVITIPDGSILEDRIVTSAGSYSAQANMDPGSWIMQAVAFRGSAGPIADTVPPTVSLTAPAANATALSGSVAFTANAADTGGSGLGGVQFQVDGINVGPAITSTPFSINFNTAQFANGTHTITAYAWDGARNLTTASSVTVTFSNAGAGNPASTGWWSGTFPWPLVAIHLNMMSDGRFIGWDQFATGNPVPQIWDPVTSQFTPVQTNDSDNLFCSGHSTLPDGRLLVAGGEVFTGTGITNSHTGLTSAHIFDPVTNLWSSAASMAYGRWYPTQTTMSDGKVFTIAGEINCFNCDATIPEIYDPKANTWTQITQASLDIPWYPYTFLLPDGRLIVTGTAESPTVTRAYDPVAKSWTTIDNRTLGGGSSAMYLPGKFIKSGTPASTLDPAVASAATTYMLDMTATNPTWQTVAPMAFPRTYHVMTTLPDGSVLATGGGRTTGFADIANAVYQAEVWSPTTQSWSTMASMTAPRLYHQTAVLLPDARVLVAGSGRGYGRADATDQLSGEIYSPPYLFKGPRPVITSAPSSLTVAQNFTVQTPNAASIAKVVLIRIGSVTHTFNMDQHYVPMTFTAGSGSLTVTAPASSNLAPPGYYMLFLVDSNGVPSVSKTVRF